LCNARVNPLRDKTGLKALIFLVSILLTVPFVSNVNAVPEEQLAKQGGEKVQQYAKTYSSRGMLETPDGFQLDYLRFDKECQDTALVIVPGWTEPPIKYAELAYDLRDYGFCIYILDHRGQGSSSRIVQNPQISYVSDFERYVDDLQLFDRDIVRKRNYKRVIFLGHSMGGLITTLYAARNNIQIDGLVLSAPLFEIDGGWMPEWLMYDVASLLNFFGYGQSYAPGQGDWDEHNLDFKLNRFTHSPVRFKRIVSFFIDNPETKIGGVSNRWVQTTIDATRKVVGLAKRIKIPVLLLQADQDEFVLPERQNTFCHLAPACKKLFFPGAKHEFFSEVDPIRNKALNALIEFIRGVSEQQTTLILLPLSRRF
jgi:lysophospholipase